MSTASADARKLARNAQHGFGFYITLAVRKEGKGIRRFIVFLNSEAASDDEVRGRTMEIVRPVRWSAERGSLTDGFRPGGNSTGMNETLQNGPSLNLRKIGERRLVFPLRSRQHALRSRRESFNRRS
jgi:hypothetical protein